LRIRPDASEFRVDLTVRRFASFSAWFLAAASAVLGAGVAKAGEIDTRGAQIRLGLVAEVAAILPGEPFRVGLRIEHDPGWHTYWRQPGIVGVPTSLTWELPEGFLAGPIQWPAPERVKMLGLTAWGYERDVLLLVTITPPAGLRDGVFVDLRAKGAWMACGRTCHPGWGDFLLKLPVNAQATTPVWDPAHKPLFAEATEELPPPLEGWSATVTSDETGGLQLHLQPDDPAVKVDATAHYEVYTYTPHVHSDESPQVSFPESGGVDLALRPLPIPAEPVDVLEAVVECSTGWPPGRTRSFATIAAKWLPAKS
jgi:thiol:disulfide interchange protein DsbD